MNLRLAFGWAPLAPTIAALFNAVLNVISARSEKQMIRTNAWGGVGPKPTRFRFLYVLPKSLFYWLWIRACAASATVAFGFTYKAFSSTYEAAKSLLETSRYHGSAAAFAWATRYLRTRHGKSTLSHSFTGRLGWRPSFPTEVF